MVSITAELCMSRSVEIGLLLHSGYQGRTFFLVLCIYRIDQTAADSSLSKSNDATIEVSIGKKNS